MPTFRHSKTSRIALDYFDASSVTDNIEVKHTVDTGETTTHVDSDRKYLAGLVERQYPIAGHVDFSTALPVDKTELETKLGSSGHIVMSMCMEGYTVGRAAVLDYVHPTAYDVKAPDGDVVNFTANMVTGTTGNQNAFRGRKMSKGLVLFRSTALSTSTQAAASQDNGVASTEGYVAHLHGFGGASTGAISIQVQHSSDGASWTTLTALTAISANPYLGASRSFSTSAAVKRYVRGAVITQNSTGKPSVLLTFSRR